MKLMFDLRNKSLAELLKIGAMVLAIGAALAHFARFLFIAFSRITFPFTLEWMEGGSFVQVSRILAGQPLYVRPSFDFVPQIYPPVYFYLSALFSKVLGNSFLPLRLVSIIATLGTLALIYVLVYNQSGSKVGGILASGLFCATYELSGYWFDIARVDALALAFILLSVYLLLKDKPVVSILGGLFLALSCFTKQTMLLAVGIFIIYCLFPLRKNSLIFIGTTALAFLGGTFALDWIHEGWYSYYIFHLPSQHNVIPNLISLIDSTKEILFAEIIQPVSFAAVVGLVYLMLFPGKIESADDNNQLKDENFNRTWLRRAIWFLVLTTGILAIGSFFFLAVLPSTTGNRVLGSYSLARTMLMAGPVFIGVLVFIYAIKMKKNDIWIDRIANRLFGRIRIVPQILMGFTILVSSLMIVLTYFYPDIYEDLSIAHLQRISPYVIGPVILLVAIGLSWRLLWTSNRLDTWFFLLLGFGLIATSWLGRLNRGGYYNVLMPAYAGISILFGLGTGINLKEPSGRLSVRRNMISTFVLLLSSLQLINLLSPSAPQIPTQTDKEAGLELVNRIKACPGNVYIPYHTYLAELAGKDGYAGYIELGELLGIFRGQRDPLWYEVQDQIQFALDTRTIAAVIQDDQTFQSARSPDYIETGQVFENYFVFWPVTGWKTRPEKIYQPANAEGCSLQVDK